MSNWKGENHQILRFHPPAPQPAPLKPVPSIAVACGCCRNHGWVETSHVCYQAFIYVLPQLVTIVPTLRLLSHQLERSLVLAKNYLAVAGCLVTFPKIVKKGHNKNNIFHHVILEKTPLFILFSHIFVYYFSLSTFWFSRAKDLSPSPLHWNPLKPPSPSSGLWSSKVSSNWAIPCEALPNKLLKLTWFLGFFFMSWKHTRQV